MIDEATTGILCLVIGLVIAYIIYLSTRKKWFLETLSPREHYELGREKKLIVNLNIQERSFNGFKAGKYTVIFMHGTLGQFSKPIISGKIEEMYMITLAETLVGRKFVTKLEKHRFLDFIFRRLPELTAKARMVTAELVSPTEVLDLWKDSDKRGKALAEMRRRRLIASTVLWVKPYPPEEKLKEIMTGVLMIPDIIREHEEDLAELTATYRKTVIEVNTGMVSMLKNFIPLARYIVTSVSDPIFVLALIIADKARHVTGMGLEQLAEKGGMEGFIEAAKQIIRKKGELDKILAGVKPEDFERIMKQVTGLKAEIKKLGEQMKTKKMPLAAT